MNMKTISCCWIRKCEYFSHIPTHTGLINSKHQCYLFKSWLLPPGPPPLPKKTIHTPECKMFSLTTQHSWCPKKRVSQVWNMWSANPKELQPNFLSVLSHLLITETLHAVCFSCVSKKFYTLHEQYYFSKYFNARRQNVVERFFF